MKMFAASRTPDARHGGALARNELPPRARQQRADARRNVANIVEAATICLADNPHATMSEIADAAHVGRVTLYGHFKTRAELVEAVVASVTRDACGVLDEIDTSGDPRTALAGLVSTSWAIVSQARAILLAAEHELPADRIHAHHGDHLRRVDELIARGQALGVFRTDQPREWLVSVCYSLMHNAANECSAGRLTVEQAGNLLTTSLSSMLAPPAPGPTRRAHGSSSGRNPR